MDKRRTILSVLTILSFIGVVCAKINAPTPIPTPTPTTIPTPAPPRLPLLEVVGDEFVGAGKPVFLLGSIICCGENTKERGWPLVNHAALEEMARAGANFTHIRTGPHSAALEGQEFVAYDANGAFIQAYFDKIEALVVRADQLGIYVEVDLVDGWGPKTGNAAWPDGAGCEMFEKAPDAIREAWIRKLVKTTGKHKNVLWQDGNEIGVKPCGLHLTYEWVSALEDIVRSEEVRDGYPRHPFGTNSEREDIENAAFVDYIERHQPSLPKQSHKPTMVNEYDSISVGRWEELALAGHIRGISFHQWRGDWSEAEIQEGLMSLRAVVDSLNEM